MSSADVIDALFVKTVDMVQSLPKSGPIQTSYEEKLALYSLYKQATEGDVQSKRPGMLDMLGRAKWDAWAKVRDLSPRDAKQMYVESMLRILRRFSDRPQAVGLIEELESFSGQVAQRVMDGSLAHRDSDESSGTEEPDSDPQQQHQQQRPPAHTPSIAGTSTAATRGGEASALSSGRTPIPSDSEEETSEDDRLGPQPAPLRSASRYQSSVGPVAPPATRMYQRTNSVGGETYSRGSVSRSQIASPPPQETGFRARGGPSSAQGGYASAYRPQPPSVPGSGYPRQHEPVPYQRSTYAASSVGGRSVRTTGGGGGPMYPMRPASVTGGGGGGSRMGPPPVPRPEMEMALQSIQASLAALHERLNQVENRSPLGGSVDDVRRSRPSGNPSPRHWLYDAVVNVVQDVRQLIGLGSDTRTGAAPSFLAQRSAAVGVLGSPIKILVALVNLSARLALDLVSLVLVSSFFLYAWKRISGRGDPLMMLRLLKRAQQALLRKSPAAKQLVKEMSS